MKKLALTFANLFIIISLIAQSPEKMSYQAVIRDAEHNLVISQSVGMQISILQGDAFGEAIYVETQSAATNANGLLSIEIGSKNATVLKGTLNTIDWSTGPYYIKSETDPTGGTNYTITGTSQLLSVPYALHAKTAESINGGITETDPVFSGSEAANITITDITNLDNLSGTNTGDQDLSTLATKSALGDTTAQIRSEIPDVSAFITFEADPNVPSGTQTGEMQYWDGSQWITVSAGTEGQVLTFKDGMPTWSTAAITIAGPTDVHNPATNKIWMDRNLGAAQVADSSTDANAYGDLYQWGRAADGHEDRASSITSTNATTAVPNDGNAWDGLFITGGFYPFDWLTPQDDNLWQGVSGTNNPCPSGYRLPTDAEWEAERASWGSNNATGAFVSPLKLPVAGYRSPHDGSLGYVGSGGYYWSSTVDGAYSRLLFFGSSSAGMDSGYRARGFSVRCLKD